MPLEEKVLNSMKPIWTRPPSEVTQDEYKEFYRHISHDWTEPLKVIPYKAEGRIEYQALLFVPSQAPYDLYYVASKPGLQLYVKRIQIMEKLRGPAAPATCASCAASSTRPTSRSTSRARCCSRTASSP